MEQTNETREAWLRRAIDQYKSVFEVAEKKLPEVRVSVGLPHHRVTKVIGQHWAPAAADDNVGSIFITPLTDDGALVLAVLAHELVHAAVGNEAGHGPEFRKVALAIGLVGKMTETKAGPQLELIIDTMLKILGPYPHAKLNLKHNPIKKQAARLIKVVCRECGYIARTSRLNLETRGHLICPCNHKAMEVE